MRALLLTLLFGLAQPRHTFENAGRTLTFLDVPAQPPGNDRRVLLLPGRRAPSAPTLAALSKAGFRTLAALGNRRPDDLRALLDHVKVDRVAVLAHDRDAALALRFARDFPEMVERVLLVAPPRGPAPAKATVLPARANAAALLAALAR